MSTTLKRKASSNGPIGGSEAKKAKADSSITSFFGQPRTAPIPSASAVKAASAAATGATTATTATSTAADPPTFKFNKEKWVAGLTSEQKELLQLEIDTLDPSWLAHLKDDITTREFLDLKRFLKKELSSGKTIFPPQEDVYSWSRHTPFHNVKVVIIGQDPYHNVNQAHGLAFSVRPPTMAPPSLKNMYKALARDYPAFRPPPRGGGLLTPWADRGVLMLNTCLTVRAHEANSHANHGWERFTQRVIDLVATRRTRGVVFMAWGSPAGKRVVKIDAKRHLVLRSVHPSPLSAMRGYLDCGHYRKANEWLVTRYGEDGFIDWSLTEGVSLKPGAEDEEEEAKKKEEEEKAKVEAEAAAKAKAAQVKATMDEFGDIDIDSDLEDAVREAERMGFASAKKASPPSVSAMALDTSPLRKEDTAAVKIKMDPLGDDDTEPEDNDDENDDEHAVNIVPEAAAAATATKKGIKMMREDGGGSGSTTEEEDNNDNDDYDDDDEKENQLRHYQHQYNHNTHDNNNNDDDDGSETETEFKDNDTNGNHDDDYDDDADDDDYVGNGMNEPPSFSFTTY